MGRSVVSGGGVKVESSGVTGELSVWTVEGGWVGVGCCRREDGTPAAAARLLRSSTHPFY